MLVQTAAPGLVSAPVRQPRTPEEDADFWKTKGNEYFKFGDHKKAKECYASSIGAKETAAAYANRGLTCLKLKEWEQAIADCTQVLSPALDTCLRGGLKVQRQCHASHMRHICHIIYDMSDRYYYCTLSNVNDIVIVSSRHCFGSRPHSHSVGHKILAIIKNMGGADARCLSMSTHRQQTGLDSCNDSLTTSLCASTGSRSGRTHATIV
jgi:tetratricopeptide (TPR) repeat protein